MFGTLACVINQRFMTPGLIAPQSVSSTNAIDSNN
jgi:hypothetical protein